MNLQRREEIKAIAECPNDRHWAQEMRRAVAELFAHIDTLEQTAAERVIADGRSRAVVVPEPGDRVGWARVDRDEIDLLRLLRDRAIDTAPAGELRGIAKDALRANQGGAAT